MYTPALVKDYMYVFEFAFPQGLVPKVMLGRAKDAAGEPLKVEQEERTVYVRSAKRYKTLMEAQQAMEGTVRNLNLLGVFFGYGIRSFRAYANLASAPSPPKFLTAVLQPLPELDLGLSIRALNKLEPIAQKHRTAAKLFDDSFFLEDGAVALVLRTTGLEVLSPRQRSSDKLLDAIQTTISYLRGTDLEKALVIRLTNALGREKHLSITESVRSHMARIVPEAPDAVIKEIYNTRSKIVHGQSIDREQVFRAAENASWLLRYTILRELGFRMTEPHFILSR